MCRTQAGLDPKPDTAPHFPGWLKAIQSSLETGISGPAEVAEPALPPRLSKLEDAGKDIFEDLTHHANRQTVPGAKFTMLYPSINIACF